MTGTAPTTAAPGEAPSGVRDDASAPRNPWIAAGLTLLVTGLGHLYAGRPWRGVALWLLLPAVGSLAIVLSLEADTPALRYLPFFAALALWIGVVADAWRVARRPARSEWRPRWWVYVLIFFAASVFADSVVLGTIRARIAEAFVFPGGSMIPTLMPGDYILVDRRDVRPERGTVVAARVPGGFTAVGRIVALPGDTVEMRAGRLWIDGRPVDEPYARTTGPEPDSPGTFDWQFDFLVGDATSYRPTHGTWGPLRVPEDHVLLLGDNRSQAVDGRYWGFVPTRDLVGRPDWIYLSMERDPLLPIGGHFRWGRAGREVR